MVYVSVVVVLFGSMVVSMAGYEERRYAFYRILGAPIPLERHFFSYAE